MWPAPSKSRFYYLFWLLELMPGHLRRSILRILVLNPTHEISWSRSGFFSLRGRILRAGPPGPPLFFVFCFQPSLACSRCPGRALTERSKNNAPTTTATTAAAAPAPSGPGGSDPLIALRSRTGQRCRGQLGMALGRLPAHRRHRCEGRCRRLSRRRGIEHDGIRTDPRRPGRVHRLWRGGRRVQPVPLMRSTSGAKRQLVALLVWLGGRP